MRYHIIPHNYKLFSQSFYDTECLECTATIETGDPIGFITDIGTQHSKKQDDHGPVCYECLQNLKRPAGIQITK